MPKMLTHPVRFVPEDADPASGRVRRAEARIAMTAPKPEAAPGVSGVWNEVHEAATEYARRNGVDKDHAVASLEFWNPSLAARFNDAYARHADAVTGPTKPAPTPDAMLGREIEAALAGFSRANPDATTADAYEHVRTTRPDLYARYIRSNG